MYVFDYTTDTGGLSFPIAIQQLFVGVYFLELCLTGLFFLVRREDGSGVPCQAQGILMVVLIILTIIFQVLFYHNVSFFVIQSTIETNLLSFTHSSNICRSMLTQTDFGLTRPYSPRRVSKRLETRQSQQKRPIGRLPSRHSTTSRLPKSHTQTQMTIRRTSVTSCYFRPSSTRLCVVEPQSFGCRRMNSVSRQTRSITCRQA